MNIIHYAFGRDYLKSWTVKDALREIFQNYIDYGEYTIATSSTDNPNNIRVAIANDYHPESLEFLRLGNTSKDSGDYIGHHGEGLKAAFLIFAREELYFSVLAPHNRLVGGFQNNPNIGETLVIEYAPTKIENKKFVTSFHCPKDVYEEFISNIITENDILHDAGSYGQLLKEHKGRGNIYSGNLYVCHIDNLNYSYNIKPGYLQLDRDRRAPADWDIDYSTSKILGSFKQSNTQVEVTRVSYNARDYRYNSFIPEEEIEDIEPVTVDNKVQYYDTVNKEMISNENIKTFLNNHPAFKKDISLNKKEKFNRAKKANRRKSTLGLLKAFKAKYCKTNEDMAIDIDVIIDKINTKK